METFKMEKETGKSNLLYVFADQWRYGAQGFVKQDQAVTPNIDRFAQEGMCFTNACSTFPLCSPHRASLLTGKYPLQAGMWTNCKVGLEEKIMLKPQETCIANVLKDDGYATGYIGKWHLDASEQNFCHHPLSGAMEWDAYTPPGERRQGFDYWLSYGACDDHLHPHYWKEDAQPIYPGKWSAEFETDQALHYMEEQRRAEQPFVLFLSYNPPHLPYELVPERYFEQFQNMPVQFRENVPEEMKTEEMKIITRQYLAAVFGIDEQFGRICDFLREKGMEENTLVVLSADHGEMLGSHGLMSKNVWYEEALHIPLMMRQKGRIEKRENHTVFASPDHMPTLLELLQSEIPDTCTGISHAKGILSGTDDGPERMFICSYPGGADMVAEFSKRGLTHKSFGWRGIRTPRYTYVINNGYHPEDSRTELLYDRETDPYEQHPISVDKHTDRCLILQFREQLAEYLKENQDPFLWDRAVIEV